MAKLFYENYSKGNVFSLILHKDIPACFCSWFYIFHYLIENNVNRMIAVGFGKFFNDLARNMLVPFVALQGMV